MSDTNNNNRSTGPKTEEGKNRVRMNALKHGLYTKHPDLLDLPCEGDSTMKEAIETLTAQYQPESEIEIMLIKRIALLEWRLNRINKAERKSLHLQPGVEYSLPPADIMERILRYERTVDREFHRAIRQLETIIAARKKTHT